MLKDSGSALACPLSGVRVLVVDDYADARDLFAVLLTMGGAEVSTAASAAEAFSALADFGFDAMVSDVHMPEESGLELIRRVRVDFDAIRLPAVAVTADRDPSLRAQLLEAGFQNCLCKPVGVSELVAALRDLIAGPHSRVSPRTE